MKSDKHLERRKGRRPGLLSLTDFIHFLRHLPKTVKSIHSIGIRQATLNDLPALQKVEEVAWPEEARASVEMIASRIKTFPEGVLCAIAGEEIVGFTCLEIIRQSLDQIQGDWMTLADDGFIKKTHDVNGSILFGVSLSVVPKAPKDTAFALCEAAKRLTIRKGLSWVALGSRLPRYHQFASELSVAEYVLATQDKRQLDPELDLYRRVGMIPIRVLPNFFPDPSSCNYGVLLAWENPFKEIQGQMNVWEDFRWFSLWETKMRRRPKSWKI